MIKIARINMPDEEGKEAIRKNLKTISNEMTMIEAHRETIKETIKALAEKYEIPARLLRKMAGAYHRQTFDAEKQDMEDFEDMYEAVMITEGE